MYGQIKENTMVNGIKIKCMDMESQDGLMDDHMRESNKYIY